MTDTEQNEKTSTKVKEAVGILTSIERATEFRTFLLLANLVIALNIGVNSAHGKRLSELTWTYVKTNLSIGDGLIFVTIFALCMSCGMTALRYISEQFLVLITPSSVFGCIGRSDSSVQNPKHFVRSYQLLEAASDDERGEYLQLYKKHVQTRNERRIQRDGIAALSFSLLVMLVLDVVLLRGNSLAVNFVMSLNSVLEHAGDVCAVLVVMFLIVCWLQKILFDDDDEEWILCPRLYELLEIKRSELRRKNAQHLDRAMF